MKDMSIESNIKSQGISGFPFGPRVSRSVHHSSLSPYARAAGDRRERDGPEGNGPRPVPAAALGVVREE